MLLLKMVDNLTHSIEETNKIIFWLWP